MGSMAPRQEDWTQKAKKPDGHKATGRRCAIRVPSHDLLIHDLSPIKRVRPGPGRFGTEQAIAGANEIVGRVHVVRRVRDDRTPPSHTRTRLHGPHQAQLEPMSAMLAHHANAAKIAGVKNMGRWNNTGEGNRPGPIKRNPPMSLIKLGNGSGVEESQLVKFRQHISNIIITPVNLANSIQCWPALLSHHQHPALPRIISRA